MRIRRDETAWVELESVDSTQDYATKCIRKELPGPVPGVILAAHQTAGRGRLGRNWHSEPGSSLAMSVVLDGYAGDARPWLLGMAMACAAAGVLHCRLRWPNDLFLEGKKLGGILTEIVEGIPVLGIGVNLNHDGFPAEIEQIATSLTMHRKGPFRPKEFADRILSRFEKIERPQNWADLAPTWDLFDDTPGKHYRLQSGEEAIAVGIGPHGELLCSVHGESRTVMAAEAILGS